MANFTLFAYGTGENSRTTHNIISQFSKACVSKHTVLEGPDLLGRNVGPNADEGAKRIINWLKKQPDENNSLNLTGFSRGSITCIRIANLLQSKKEALEARGNLNEIEQALLIRLKQLNLTMFLMDPVAGLTDKRLKGNRVIPDIVTNYVAMLQKDERRRDFKPQDMSRIIISEPQKTKVTMLPMYGNHSDNTKIKSNGMESGTKLAWYTLYQVLTQHGTKFTKDTMPQIAYSETYLDEKNQKRPSEDLPKNPNVKELLHLFSDHHKNRVTYLKSGLTAHLADGIPSPRTERSLNRYTQYYVKHSAFFVNQLERELFKIAYPKSFNYLFENNQKDLRFPADSCSSRKAVITELEGMANTDNALFKSLAMLGVKTSNKGVMVGEPHGYNYLEPCISMQQIYPNFVPDSVKENTTQMSKLALLEIEVYRLTFIYEREKGEFNFAGRKNSGRTQQIRKEINHLVNHGTQAIDEKYTLILDQLEQHYKELILSNGSVTLLNMLGKILAEHGRTYRVQLSSIANAIMIDLIYYSLSLAKEVVCFVGNLGYVGGLALFAIGSALEAIGKRCNELIDITKCSPLELIGVTCASLLEGIGFMIKHSFGIRPLSELLVYGIERIRDMLTETLNTMIIEKIDPETIVNLKAILEDSSDPLVRMDVDETTDIYNRTVTC